MISLSSYFHDIYLKLHANVQSITLSVVILSVVTVSPRKRREMHVNIGDDWLDVESGIWQLSQPPDLLEGVP